ncbi:MAG TPA: hypothetical protein VFP15_14850 [Gemmatimonadaceae bacterium]|nr:hypothetical protein [Gemmatimonadaceae bacterium]
MLRVLSDGDNRYRLENDSNLHVGWINGRAIGFRGFATEAEAMIGASTAWRALHGVLRRQYPGWPNYQPSFGTLRLVHDGAYEWFADGTSPIARLIRPQRRAYDLTFGIELVLPSYASEGVAIAAAHAVGGALAQAESDSMPPLLADFAIAPTRQDGGDAA